jgi:hypothetical protein
MTQAISKKTNHQEQREFTDAATPANPKKGAKGGHKSDMVTGWWEASEWRVMFVAHVIGTNYVILHARVFSVIFSNIYYNYVL